MKTVFTSFFVLVFINCFAQSTMESENVSPKLNNKTSVDKETDPPLIWYRFKRGRPDKIWLQTAEIEKQIAEEWGFIIEFVFSSGAHEADKRIKEYCHTQSKKTLKWLKRNYGKAWQQKFSTQINARLKE